MRNLRAIFTLGRVAHESVLKALGIPARAHSFSHGARYKHGTLCLVSSYHCSRYNTNTGVLTAEMFNSVLSVAKSAVQAE